MDAFVIPGVVEKSPLFFRISHINHPNPGQMTGITPTLNQLMCLGSTIRAVAFFLPGG
jgi:hypothetical protein